MSSESVLTFREGVRLDHMQEEVHHAEESADGSGAVDLLDPVLGCRQGIVQSARRGCGRRLPSRNQTRAQPQQQQEPEQVGHG